jgi:hypothetical protein
MWLLSAVGESIAELVDDSLNRQPRSDDLKQIAAKPHLMRTLHGSADLGSRNEQAMSNKR